MLRGQLVVGAAVRKRSPELAPGDRGRHRRGVTATAATAAAAAAAAWERGRAEEARRAAVHVEQEAHCRAKEANVPRAG
jgi:hypothetical protein